MRRWLLLLGLILWWPTTLHAQTTDTDLQSARGAWLVTYAPGSVYWQRFGHNAIWLKLPEQGIDHLFNYGYFDFQQPNFLGRFIQGRMLYMAAASTPEQEFALYQSENRGIKIQRLDITERQLQRLSEHLFTDIRPENRDYRYDYFLDNCSTRIRDALNVALNGAVKSQLSARPAKQNFRSHVNSLSAGDYWLSIGLAIGLGSPVDRERSAFEEGFIPGVLSEQIALLENPATGRQLAGPVAELFTGESESAGSYEQLWFRYLLLGLGIVVALWIVFGIARKRGIRRAAIALCMLLGLPGLLLAYLAFLTDHSAAAGNINLLLFNPLYLVLGYLLFRKNASTRGPALVMVVLLACWIAGFVLGSPVMNWQDNAAVLALTAPMILLVAVAAIFLHPRVSRDGP